MSAIVDYFHELSQYNKPLRVAGRAFVKDRLSFYSTLADLLEDTDGKTNFLQIFMRDADRYAGTPRGVLSKHWAEAYELSGASLAATWDGTLPSEEVSLIGVAEQGGIQATIVALRDLSRVGEVIEKAKKEFKTTVVLGMVGIAIALGMLIAVPFFFVPFLRGAFGFVPSEFWGTMTRAYFNLGSFIKNTWYIFISVVVVGLLWLQWALPNWIGPLRVKADEQMLIFRLYRDFKGSLFLAMFASLTKSRGGATTNQREALMMMQQGSTQWLGWKIRAILERIDEEGGLDASMLDVGVVDKSVYFLFADIYEARGVAAGLSAAGLRSEQRATVSIAAKAKALRGLLLFGALGIVIGLMVWQNVVVFEFKGAMVTYMNSK